MKITPINLYTNTFQCKKGKERLQPEQRKLEDKKFDDYTKYASIAFWLASLGSIGIYSAVAPNPYKDDIAIKEKPQEKVIKVDDNFRDTVIVQDINDDNKPEIIFIDKDKNKVAYDLQTHKIIRENNDVENDD